jgi:hypothetical protein
MKIDIVDNVFSGGQIQSIKESIEHELRIRDLVIKSAQSPELTPENKTIIFKETGRLDLEMIKLSEEVVQTITKIANRYTEDEPFELIPFGAFYAEYSGKHGTPSLGPHYDGGDCNFMLDYQLEANVDWAIGMDENAYTIKDNQALTLYPLSLMHWRPKKSFKKEDYVKMIFFRFFKASKPKVESPTLSKEKLDKIQHVYENFYLEEYNV